VRLNEFGTVINRSRELLKQTLDLAEGLPDLLVAFLAVKIDPHRNRRHRLKVVGRSVFKKKKRAKKLKETEMRVCLLSTSRLY
jgi:hypothetical protein